MAIDRSRSNSYYPGTDTKVTDSIYIYKCNHCGHSAWALIRKDVEVMILTSNQIMKKASSLCERLPAIG